MELSLHYRLKCDEAADEPESVSFEKTLKVSCNISNAVNYMQQGIMEVRCFSVKWRTILTTYSGA